MMRSFTIGELAEEAGVTPRTIRFYTAEGLLPPPDTRGRYARYGEEHLERLRMIQQLKEAFLPLQAIRAHLESIESGALGLRDVAQMDMPIAAAPAAAPKTSDSASNYIRRLMNRIPPAVRERSAPKPPPAASSPGMAGPASPQAVSESWDRIQITPDCELHVRAPRSPLSQKLIDRLFQAVQAENDPTKEAP